MENGIILTIVTINLNNKDGLQKTIDSIISQTYKNYEWIVIDGGSTDGSKELIETYNNYINYWVSEKDYGIYDAMNKGIRASRGEYLLFLNSGDKLYDRKVINEIIQHLYLKESDFLIGKEYHCRKYWDRKIDDYYDLIETCYNYWFPHQSTFINREMFHRYGLYDTNYIISDWIFFFKALILGNASIKRLNVIISVYENDGTAKYSICQEERQKYLSEMPRIKELLIFYLKHYKRIEWIKKFFSKKIIKIFMKY